MTADAVQGVHQTVRAGADRGLDRVDDHGELYPERAVVPHRCIDRHCDQRVLLELVRLSANYTMAQVIIELVSASSLAPSYPGGRTAEQYNARFHRGEAILAAIGDALVFLDDKAVLFEHGRCRVAEQIFLEIGGAGFRILVSAPPDKGSARGYRRGMCPRHARAAPPSRRCCRRCPVSSRRAPRKPARRAHSPPRRACSKRCSHTPSSVSDGFAYLPAGTDAGSATASLPAPRAPFEIEIGCDLRLLMARPAGAISTRWLPSKSCACPRDQVLLVEIIHPVDIGGHKHIGTAGRFDLLSQHGRRREERTRHACRSWLFIELLPISFSASVSDAAANTVTVSAASAGIAMANMAISAQATTRNSFMEIPSG